MVWQNACSLDFPNKTFFLAVQYTKFTVILSITYTKWINVGPVAAILIYSATSFFIFCKYKKHSFA